MAPSPVLYCYLFAVARETFASYGELLVLPLKIIGWAFVNRGNILRRNTFSRVAKDLTSLTSGGVFAMYFDVRQALCHLHCAASQYSTFLFNQ